jgi:hypothetical protein
VTGKNYLILINQISHQLSGNYPINIGGMAANSSNISMIAKNLKKSTLTENAALKFNGLYLGTCDYSHLITMQNNQTSAHFKTTFESGGTVVVFEIQTESPLPGN